MTRLTLISAGPTPWDLEDRVVGAHSLPLADEALTAARALVASLAFAVDSIYCPRQNEACLQIARLVGQKFNLRVRNNAGLETWNLGLWEGLRREELRYRFETVMPAWEERPWSVIPPEGELFGDAVERLRGAMTAILRRNRGYSAAIAVRPVALQILLGLLRKEDIPTIARHLREKTPMETMEFDDATVRAYMNDRG